MLELVLYIMKQENKIIKIYSSNLIERTDRRDSIINQFSEKTGFELNIVPAITHKIGRIGLWRTFMKILRTEEAVCSPFFVFCEDDHIFTKSYNYKYLVDSISQADALGADVLLGGVSWMKHPIQISDHIFWLEAFNGMQFTVVFQRFYKQLIAADRECTSSLDFKISDLSDNIMVMYPFISIQKEFGYSDVTKGNEKDGYIKSLFNGTSQKLDMLSKIRVEYQKRFKP